MIQKGIEMFELLTTVIFTWLLVKTIGLAFRLTWGMAKIIATIMMVIALPVLIFCLVFVGGLALMIPIAVIGMAFGLLKACV